MPAGDEPNQETPGGPAQGAQSDLELAPRRWVPGGRREVPRECAPVGAGDGERGGACAPRAPCAPGGAMSKAAIAFPDLGAWALRKYAKSLGG